MSAATRGAFARAISDVREGTSAADVEALLGEPDDVRTPYDSLGGVVTHRTRAVWCYGTDGHLSTPTLGSVYLDEQDKVQFVFGGGEALPEGAFDEGELRRLLRILDRAPSYEDGEGFDPLRLIRAVNALQPLGKDRALAAIGEYLRVAPPHFSFGREGMFLVLRLLFDVPADAGGQPAMIVGLPHGPQPDCPADAPRYPLLVCDDVPFLAVSGFTLRGSAEDPTDHLGYFRERGRLRDGPLTPTDQPFNCLQGAEGRWPWMFAEGGLDCRRLLAMQVLKLVASVHRPALNDAGHPAPYQGWRWGAQGYPEDVMALSRLAVRWDVARCRYTRPDGSWLPEEEQVNYRTLFWELGYPGVKVKANITRENHRSVWVGVGVEAEGPVAVPQFRFEVYRGRATGRPVCEVSLGGAQGFSSTGTGLILPLGHELQLRAVAGKETWLSPVFRPRPHHPVAFSPEWRTDAVAALAREMYSSEDFSVMPILADALQDAGCDDEQILSHCRDTSFAHVRGCWVVDLALAQE
jgi:hypothetical protein